MLANQVAMRAGQNVLHSRPTNKNTIAQYNFVISIFPLTDTYHFSFKVVIKCFILVFFWHTIQPIRNPRTEAIPRCVCGQ